MHFLPFMQFPEISQLVEAHCFTKSLQFLCMEASSGTWGMLLVSTTAQRCMRPHPLAQEMVLGSMRGSNRSNSHEVSMRL